MRKSHKLLMFFVTVMICCITVIGAGGRWGLENARIQQGLAKQIIRFHVRANSDTDKDQQLKLKVKDAIVTYLEPVLAASESVEESRTLLVEHTENIKKIALDTLREEGSTQTVSVYFEKSYFPMKSYGDVTFPPGEYEAFRVDIGESNGKNWWCVLYPPLCFVDASYGVLPDKSRENLKNILTDEEYNAITENQCEYRFKYFTFLNKVLGL